MFSSRNLTEVHDGWEPIATCGNLIPYFVLRQITRRQSFFRQGLAGDPFVKAFDSGPNDPVEAVPWGQGSQQSQLMMVTACRLAKLEGSRPRSLIDWAYSPIMTTV